LKCLDRVVENAPIKRPFLFVGFSIGALVGRRYVSLYPNDIAGMVIVDHAFLPAGDDGLPPAKPPGDSDSPPVLIEKTPIILTTEETSDFRKLPDRVQELHHWAESRKPAPATAETAKDCLSELESTKKTMHPLGHIPLVVISTGNTSAGYGALQHSLLLLSANSKQLMAERSFHSVEIDQPEVVIRAITQAVQAVKTLEP